MKPSRRRDASSPDDVNDREMPGLRRDLEQCALFDLEKLAGASEHKNRVTALDRRFVIAALRDIHRLSTEPHIRRIADDVLFAHRIPTEEKSS